MVIVKLSLQDKLTKKLDDLYHYILPYATKKWESEIDKYALIEAIDNLEKEMIEAQNIENILELRGEAKNKDIINEILLVVRDIKEKLKTY